MGDATPHHSSEMAPAGHSSTQVPQSTQSPGSTFALSPSMVIAAAGQTATHVSHPVHPSGPE